MTRVAYFTAFSQQVIDLVADLAPKGFEIIGRSNMIPEDEKIEIVREADFIIWHGGRISEAVVRAGTRVRLLQLLSAGYDNIDLDLMGELGIPVSNVGGANREGVAEMAVTLMLVVSRRLCQIEAGLRSGLWKNDMSSGIDTFELTGKTVGIVGFGNIGRMVAKLLKGFDNRILITDTVAHAEAEKALEVTRVSLNVLLRESDIVTLHTPLLPQTRRLIGPQELDKMKPTAILINTSRGEIVNEEALIKALEGKAIRGAGLDVFENEPINRGNPLLSLENVVLSPHAAGGTYESWPRRARFAYDNIQRVLDGKEPLSLVSK
jgi:phosphoglycerate dehydrogenase-like enzyme